MANSNKIREALVLLILQELDERNLTPIKAFDLHQLVRKAQTPEFQPFKYLDRPISFSFDLDSALGNLEKRFCLEELLLMRNGWVPRLEFKLSPVGRAQAKEEQAMLASSHPDLVSRVKNEVSEFAAQHEASLDIDPR